MVRVIVKSKEESDLIIVVSFIFSEQQLNLAIYSATKLHSHHLFNRDKDDVMIGQVSKLDNHPLLIFIFEHSLLIIHLILRSVSLKI